MTAVERLSVMVQRLLDELCIDLGFCLPSNEQLRLRKYPSHGPDAITDAVFAAEGLDPALYRQLRSQVRSRVAARLGDIIDAYQNEPYEGHVRRPGATVGARAKSLASCVAAPQTRKVSIAESYASLRIMRPGMSAAAVTARLGIEPTYAHEVGDAFGRGDQRRKQAMWSLSTQADGPGRLDEHLARLLDRVEPKRSIIEDLANEGHTMDWFCFVGVEGGQGGVVLGIDLLRRLAALPVELDLDIYG